MDLARITNLLADLVRIESVNPALVPGGSGEREIAHYVCDYLKRAGLEAELQEAAPGRYNAIGILRGRGNGRRLMLNGHLDTVGVAGMEEPFSARVVEGRLHGRGSEDMKSGLAAALAAAEELAAGPPLAGDVVVAAVADEEHQSLGTRALLEKVRTDAAIVTEPTGLVVATAHKGFAWAELVTEGRAAHGSRPSEGVDAIVMMGRVLVEIERLEQELIARPPHPRLGRGSVHASLISGGQELSSYPAECRLSVERRLLPGENGSTFKQELERVLDCAAAGHPNFRAKLSLGYSVNALETPAESPIVQTLSASARRVLHRDVELGVQSFWTDADLLSEAGIPSVLFGPAGAGLHGAVEYAELNSVLDCARVLVECARAFCG
jgi:acetylornithine deacetylase/succinyl-diaminopimelate desuccinylase family protein